ncbi:MAG: DUF5017 domain-containing protein [Alistipes sp.]
MTRMKKGLYIATMLLLTAGAMSCEHDEIYEKINFAVTLASNNTYRTGEPVTFNFEGNSDYLTVWNGSTGHQYKYKDRTTVAMEDIESCKFRVDLKQQYGDADPAVRNLDLIISNSFKGLTGDNAEQDRATISAIASSNYEGWNTLDYKSNRLAKYETYQYDITKYASNFAFAIHLYHDPAKNMRTYFVNPSIEVKLTGYETQTLTFKEMSMICFSTTDEHKDDPYVHNLAKNAIVRLSTDKNAIAGADIAFQGFNAGKFAPIDQWVFMRPTSLNLIDPDQGENIKAFSNDVSDYTCTYTKPGTYTVTFIASKGNYMGESRVIKEVTVTIIDPLK